MSARSKTCIFVLALMGLVISGGLLFISQSQARGVSYDSGGRRDPMIPLIGPDGVLIRAIDSSSYVVEGIIMDPKEGSLALINGEFYRTGDKIRDVILKKIYEDHVILAPEEGEDIVLWIDSETMEEEETL
ncbi:MAG: hypothetical protein NC930_03600 [Candidatus Omnitrophica bacterium]|nr:hypothetical protein [Candidatus Omnitrophota bacterium]